MKVDFKVENYDFEKELNAIKESIAKPNILVCGATGVGKSSLINDIFGESVAKVGEGEPITRGIAKYSHDLMTVNLYDSEGYEVGEEKQSYFSVNVLGCIDKYKAKYPNELNKHIHEVWYCVSAANKRFTDTDIEVVKDILRREVPIAIVITQIDSVDEQELNSMMLVINKEFPNLSHFNYCVTNDADIKEAVETFVEKDKLIKWADKVLPDVLKEGLISALKGNLTLKRNMVQNKIIPLYVASAAATALTPIPFSDAAILVPIQITMSLHIMNVYGMDKIKGTVSSVISSQIISQVGRMIAKSVAGNLAKIIPGIGTGVGIVVNATVASTITTVLGQTISLMSYNYSKAILAGKEVDILEFFGSETFQEIFKSVLKRKGK